MDPKMKELFDELLVDIGNKIAGNDQLEREEIGNLDRDLLNKHIRYKTKMNDLHEDIELEKDKLEIEVNQRLKAFVRAGEDEIRSIKLDFWESVYERYSLDPNKRYQVKDGVLYRVTSQES